MIDAYYIVLLELMKKFLEVILAGMHHITQQACQKFQY